MPTREPGNATPVRWSLRVYTGVILGGAVVVLLIAALIGAHRTAEQTPLGTPIPDEGRRHVPDFSSFTNEHHPPSSGPHYGSVLAPGYYSTPVPEGSYVHNLEHGYVVILFKRTERNLADQLRDLPTTFPVAKYGSVKLIVVPYDEMEYPVIALAWDRELPLTAVDRTLLLRFYQQYVDHGPEDAP